MTLDLSAINAPYVATEALHAPAPSASSQARALNDNFGRGSRDGLPPILLSGPVLAALADAYSTNLALGAGNAAYDRGMDYASANPGTHTVPILSEYNGLLRDFAGQPSLYGVKAGVGLGISGLSELLARKVNRRLGKGVAIAGTAIPALLAGHNMLQARKADRAYR